MLLLLAVNLMKSELLESVTIYSSTTCSSCRVLMNWLDSNNVAYSKILTDNSDAAMVEFMSINDGVLAVPLTVIRFKSGDETKIHGFHKSKFKEVLEL